MSKHTPAPWKIDRVQGDYLYIFAEQGKKWDNPTICTFYDDVTPEDSVTMAPWYKAHDNAEANARLIAAAPTMRDALEALIAAADREAAILKAGEAAGKSDKEIDDELAAAIVDRVLAEEKARAAIKAAKEGA